MNFLWGSSQKLTAIRGHVKKIGKLRGVVRFLNGAFQIPPAPLPHKKLTVPEIGVEFVWTEKNWKDL